MDFGLNFEAVWVYIAKAKGLLFEARDMNSNSFLMRWTKTQTKHQITVNQAHLSSHQLVAPPWLISP